jgi:uncharacterized protein (DUF2236 family)
VAAVDRPDLERALARLRATVDDPRGGIFGPSSRVWAINREAVIFLGGGRAALLQLAHPVVAQAVADHSRAREDMLGRFLRTFEHVFAMVWGDLDAAAASARRVHAIHAHVRGIVRETTGGVSAGTRYEANQPGALLWVHATLWETSLQIFEMVIRPLSAPEKDAYWEETKRFAALFGIPEELVPADWTAFRRYWDGMLASDVIRVSPTARDLADFLLRTPAWWLGPAWQWLRVITARLLPPRLRAEFGLGFGPLECAMSETSVAALRAGWWLLPGSLRYLPAYREAERRLGVRNPVGAIVDQLVDQVVDQLRDRLVWLARTSR